MFYSFNLQDCYSQLTVVVIAIYLLSSLCYSISFINIEAIAFPVLNKPNSMNTLFVLFSISYLLFPIIFDIDTSCSLTSFCSEFYSSFFQIILLLSTSMFLYLSKELTTNKKLYNFEYDLIIGFSLLGLLLINSCNDFLMLYLAIELQSLCFYVLATFNKHSEYCVEAGVKYFVLGAFASGLLLFSFTLFYVTFGSLSFEVIERLNTLNNSIIALTACFSFSFAMFFKLGVFPFHSWLCDVYDGSVITITAFFSAIPKLILLSFFIKVTFIVFVGYNEIFSQLLLYAGLLSICFASLAALYQKRIKRLMAYSTISHSGFLILGVSCFTIDSVKACIFYIVVYIAMTLCLFGVLFLSSTNNKQKYLINWTALYERNYAIGLTFSIILLSIAGIPPLAGFYSKLCIILSLLANNHVITTIIIAIFSSIACFYYIRLVKIMFFTSNTKRTFWFGHGSKNIEIFLSSITVLIVLLLLRPSSLISLTTLTAVSL